jgi:hypothetical protein
MGLHSSPLLLFSLVLPLILVNAILIVAHP